METVQNVDVEESQVDVQEMLELQLSEIEMLESMFPEKDEFQLDDPVVISEIRSFLDGKIKYEFLQGRIGFTLKLSPGNHKVMIEVACLFPHEYPFVAPCVFTRCEKMDRSSHSQLNEDLQQFISSLDRGEICMFSVIEWIQANFGKYLKKEIKIKKKEVEYDTTFSRLWIYSHHIYSKIKRRAIIDWAHEMKLTGFSLPGKPGIICIEGFSQTVDDYWARLRGMNWKRLCIRERENSDMGKKDISKFQAFENFEEKCFETRHGKAREYHMDMGLFFDFLKEHGFEYIFSYYFGIDGKGTSSVT